MINFVAINFSWPFFACRLLLALTSRALTTQAAFDGGIIIATPPSPTTAPLPVPKSGPPGTVTAVVGAFAIMPCNITSADTLTGGEDFVTLILWYKDDTGGAPIYTVDSRDHPIETARHFPSEFLDGRSSFDITTSPAQLKMTAIVREDDGLYKCRVDYRRGRTTYTSTFLSVIVPPERVSIMDGARQVIHGGKSGPYEEDGEVQLTCRAEGGRPPPALNWFRDGRLIDDTYTVLSEGVALGHHRTTLVVENHLVLGSVGRDDLNSVLECRAVPTNDTALPAPPITSQIEAQVTLDITLRPLSVEITTRRDHISAGRKLEVTCTSTGSRPPAQITWTKSRKRLEHSRESFSPDGNVTTSVLVFMPTKDDDGGHLVCSAENLRMTNSTIEAQWPLKVYYDPKLVLTMGSSAKVGLVREIERSQLDCTITANPPHTKFGWTFNGVPLTQTENIIMSNMSLVITRTTRRNAGKYLCWASNAEGRSISNPLTLDVHYPPSCRDGQKTIYGASIGETIAVSCDVDASPTQVMFFWVFNRTSPVDVSVNGSANASQLMPTSSTAVSNSNPKLKYVSDGTRSHLYFTPASRLDFGTFECWGRNVIGSQTQSCVFHVMPAGPPESVNKCTVYNSTANSMVINCYPGYDGGLRQSFYLEVYEYKKEQLVSNVTRLEAPQFIVSGLVPDTPYVLVVYSANSKGKSGRTTLTSHTNTLARMATIEIVAHDQPTHEPGWAETAFMPAMGVATGSVMTLLLVAVIVAVVVRVRKPESSRSSTDMTPSSSGSDKFDKHGSNSNLLDGHQSMEAKLLPQGVGSPTSPRNPDVIPSLAGLSPRYEVDPLMGIKRAPVNFLEPSIDLIDPDGFELGSYPTPVATLDYEPRLDLALSSTRHTVRFSGSDPTTRKYESEPHGLFTPPTRPRNFSHSVANELDEFESVSPSTVILSQTLPRRPVHLLDTDPNGDPIYVNQPSRATTVGDPHHQRSTHSLRSSYEPDIENDDIDQIPLQTISTVNRRLNRRNSTYGGPQRPTNINGFSTPV